MQKPSKKRVSTMKALPSAGHDERSQQSMDYFSSQTIFFCGIVVGIAFAVSIQLAIKELFHQRRPH